MRRSTDVTIRQLIRDVRSASLDRLHYGKRLPHDGGKCRSGSSSSERQHTRRE
jgi:hypothetical protein